jgi:hypothetical protein
METASLDSPECPESEPPPPLHRNHPTRSLACPSSASQAPCRPPLAMISSASRSWVPCLRLGCNGKALKLDRDSFRSPEQGKAGGAGRATRAQRLCPSFGITGGIQTIGCSMGSASRIRLRRGGARSFQGSTRTEDENDTIPPAISPLSTLALVFVFSEFLALALDASESLAIAPLLHTAQAPAPEPIQSLPFTQSPCCARAYHVSEFVRPLEIHWSLTPAFALSPPRIVPLSHSYPSLNEHHSLLPCLHARRIPIMW